jgi:hypothetical protein
MEPPEQKRNSIDVTKGLRDLENQGDLKNTEWIKPGTPNPEILAVANHQLPLYIYII